MTTHDDIYLAAARAFVLAENPDVDLNEPGFAEWAATDAERRAQRKPFRAAVDAGRAPLLARIAELEAVGQCFDCALAPIGGATLICTLPHGHPGAHSDGIAHWLLNDPAEAPDGPR